MTALAVLAAVVVVAMPNAAGARTTQAATFSGLSCSTWVAVTAPANTVSATFTITGGGGRSGSRTPNGRGTGQKGGAGGKVTGTYTLSAGAQVWAKIGCGASGTGGAAGYASGGTSGGTNGGSGGGGGGATALCVGASSLCSGGTVIAIAPGGGGGGGGADNGGGACTGTQNGGAAGDGNGGSASTGAATAENGGNGKGGGSGSTGEGTQKGRGGSGGGGVGQAGEGGSAAANNIGGAGAPKYIGGFLQADGGNAGSKGADAVAPTDGSTGGAGGNGGVTEGIAGGAGGGGYAGGGGGAGGRQSVGLCLGTYDGGGGGAAGASWVRSTVTGTSYGSGAANQASCVGSTVSATNAGAGGSQVTTGNGSTVYQGCSGYVTLDWTINEAPTGVSPGTALDATKGTALPITLAATDPDGDNPVTCAIVTGPAKGTLNNNATCTPSYTASANTNGADSFTYKVTDALGAVSITNYTVPLNIVNRAPAGAAAGPLAATKGVALAIPLTNTDLDADNRTCSVVTGLTPNTGTLVLSGGAPSTNCSASYTAPANSSGSVSFTYKVNDGFTDSATTYTVSINIANALPLGAAQTVNVDAGVLTNVTLAATDTDGDSPLTCKIFTAGAGSLSGGVPGTLCARTYQSSPGQAAGNTVFQYKPNDGIADGAPYNVTFNVSTPDVTLTKSSVTPKFNEGGQGVYTLTVTNSAAAVASPNTVITDTLPAGLTFASSDNANGFTCVGPTSTVTCTRTTAIPKSTSLAVTITVNVANGASSGTNSAVVSNPYEVGAALANDTATAPASINHRPVANDQSKGTDLNTPVAITLTGTDPDGDTLTFTPTLGDTANGQVSGSGATVQYAPDTDYVGTDTFTFTVTDPGGLVSGTGTVTVYVGVGNITGTVTDEQTLAGLSGVEVRVVDYAVPASPVFVGTVVTGAGGTYNLGSLFPGTQNLVPKSEYRIRFVDPTNNHISEWYNNKATSALADPLQVNSGSLLTANAALTQGVRIQGTVRSTILPNAVIAGIQVRLYTNGNPAGSQAFTTDVAGHYIFELLPANTYQLFFRDVNSGLWVSEYYNDQASLGAATPIPATVGQQITINAQLAPVNPPQPNTGVVSGTVTSTGGGNPPIQGIQVRLYPGPAYTTSTATVTDVNGAYSFTGLAPGAYKVFFRDVNSGLWVSEYNLDKPDLATADPVNAVNLTTTTVNATLAPTTPPVPNNATVSGVVYQDDGITPIQGIQVRLYPFGNAASSTAVTTDANGAYSFTGKAPGQYQLFFRDLTIKLYVSEWYNDKPDQASADPITLTNETPTVISPQLAYK